MNKTYSDLDLRQVINAAGTMTSLGAAVVNNEALAAATDILTKPVEMHELHRWASTAIARACGAEAGCVTACVASAISVAVAATMTGDDLAVIEQLPETADLKNEVILQKGHNCHFSGEIGQMVRLSGAKIIEIGSVNRTTPYQLQGVLSETTTAGLYVVSHQTVQTGMLELEEFVEICHARNVPVIIDASAEYDLKKFLDQGADLVLYSAHKFLGGLTAGLIAGRKDLVRACYLQERGIGRAMKVGKEGVASAIAVLNRWDKLDKASLWQRETKRSHIAIAVLNNITDLSVSLESDPTGNPVNRVRLRFDPEGQGIGPLDLSRMLAHETPAIYVRAHDTDPLSLLLDPCNLTDEEMRHVCQRIVRALAPGMKPDRYARSVPPNEDIQNWPDPPSFLSSSTLGNASVSTNAVADNLVELKQLGAKND